MAACGAKGNAEEEAKSELNVGDYVLVDKDKEGKLQFQGKDKNTKKIDANAVLFGVHLAEKRGTGNGTFKGFEFFKCPEGYGVMVKESRIKPLAAPKDATKKYFAAWDATCAAEEEKEAAAQAAIEARAAAKSAIIAVFSQADEDNSASVEKAEFVAFFEGKGTAKADAEALFAKIDVTKNGSISMAETDSWVKSCNTDEDKALLAKFVGASS